MTYEDLLICADREGLCVKEKDLLAYDGRIKGMRVAIRRSIGTPQQKACVLAEELGHYYTSAGDIMDLSCPENRKQELRARGWAYDIQIGLDGLISAISAGCHSTYEIAEYLDVTESFLDAALQYYHDKYGTAVRHGRYVLQFDPYVDVRKSK